jgi:alkanesulfonate monooxygenase SsuD/methylene tetrahydromethanopterin reductase-like flavin-dependent oxidoreductase (luciferase family)
MLPVGDMDGPGGRTPTWDDVRAIAETAETTGLDSVWIADHLLARMPDGTVHGMHDAWTLLSAVAAVTSRVELGPLVLCSSFRSPSVIANMAATLDAVAGGRLVLGLGAGWHDPEYEAFGFPTDHRVSRFAEALEIIARLLRGERVTFDGRYYAVSEAALTPAPARTIPVLVAAKLPRMLRLTVRWADAWNTAWFSSPDDRLHKRLELLEEAFAAESRVGPELVRTLGIVVGDEDTPSDVARGLETWAGLGFHHVIAQPESLTADSVERFASGVRLYRGR